jgi:hypothetical protein
MAGTFLGRTALLFRVCCAGAVYHRQSACLCRILFKTVSLNGRYIEFGFRD